MTIDHDLDLDPTILTPDLDPDLDHKGSWSGEGSRFWVKVGEVTRSRVKGGGGVKVVGQDRGQGLGWVRVKVRGVKRGGHDLGSRGWSQGQSGLVGEV